ncbi:MAG: serine/threonine protein kinase [Verrucomicrobiae bacterium]|nr:serine/threonine protein kinase [Verrucomicrobiae bacterium]
MDTVIKQTPKVRLAVCGRCNAKLFIPSNLGLLETTSCNKCGHPVFVPVRIDNFEFRAVIGSGGMGIVYRAYDVMLEREVAIKLMKKDLLNDPQAVESFYREARICASLNHTNIIHIYAFGEYEEQPYIVMELADNGSLDQRIEQEHCVPELEVLDIGIKVASALDMALKHGLLHRDIKPGNILFNADKEPKLVDFGLAGSATDTIHDPSAVWGTPYYVAPEKIKREGETFLSDMYSLAGTLYHALTGHVPFEAATVEEVIMAHVNTPLTPPNILNNSVTHHTSEAICIAMAKDPSHRFQSYDEFIMALTAARSHLLVSRYNGHHV